MSEDPKKLKRKLQDISPLFRAPQEMPENKVPADEAVRPAMPVFQTSQERIYESTGEILCLVDGTAAGRNHGKRIHELASRISAQFGTCSVVSFHDGKKTSASGEKNVPTYRVSRPEFERYMRSFFSAADFPPLAFPKTILLEMEYFYGKEWQRVSTFIDKFLFVVRPDFESISETYKLMKSVTALNHETECGIIFQGPPDDPRGTLIYEELSCMTSRFLRSGLLWLGYWPEGSVLGGSAETWLSLDHLFLKAMHKNHTPEKNAFFEFLRLMEAEEAMTA